MIESKHATISVALRVFNSARYIGEQLESILAQSVIPDEIVIGDDGSTDSTADIIRMISEAAGFTHPDIKWVILPSTHIGIGANIERTMAACTGDIIVVCDHDDRSRPDRFERLRAEFERRPSICFIHSEAELIDSRGNSMAARLTPTQLFSRWEQRRYRDGDAFEVLVRRNIVTGATSALRRELLGRARPFPTTWVYDEWLGIVAAAECGLDIIDDPLLDYRQHSSNKSGVRKRGFSEKMRMLRKSGGARNARQLARATVLIEKIEQLGSTVPVRYLELAKEKVRHETMRSRMPRNRILRAFPVLREAARGAYTSSGRGKKDILLDLVQPLGRLSASAKRGSS